MALGWRSVALVMAGTSLTAFGIGLILLSHLHWAL